MKLPDIEKLPDFDGHKCVSLIHSRNTGMTGFIAIHRGNAKHPSFGATRLWDYKFSGQALVDALRLSKLMSYKAALAGLPCGGAKAVLISNGEIKNRREFLKSYVEKVTMFGGRFITGADVGISRDDVKIMRRHSPYIVGIKVDPVRFTGLGILYSLQVCLKEIFGSESFSGRSIAIQGVGKVGQELLRLIYPYTHNVYIADVDKSTIEEVVAKYGDVKVVDSSVIHSQDVDIFSPCALSNCLNVDSIKEIKCKMIVGGANNQLENDEIAEKIYKMGVLYAPDYVVNAGGLISVYDEYEFGNYRINRIKKRVQVVKTNMKKIIAFSKKRDKNPTKIAGDIARDYFDTLI